MKRVGEKRGVGERRGLGESRVSCGGDGTQRDGRGQRDLGWEVCYSGRPKVGPGTGRGGGGRGDRDHGFSGGPSATALFLKNQEN